MAGSVIVIGSSPEPEPPEYPVQATPTLDDDVLEAEMASQTQSGSKNKGKQKAPAPVVYEISSDDSETITSNNNDDDEVQCTGVRVPAVAGVASGSGVDWSMEETKKRKRVSELSDPPIGSGSGSGSGSGTATLSAEGASSSSFMSTFANATTSGANASATAGPSQLPPLASLLGPMVKKARFDTDSMAPVSTSAQSTTATPTTTTVEQTHPANFVVTYGRAAGSATNRDVPKPGSALPHRFTLPAFPYGAYAPAPGPAYDGALLPPGHFYHDAPNAPPPPPGVTGASASGSVPVPPTPITTTSTSTATATPTANIEHPGRANHVAPPNRAAGRNAYVGGPAYEGALLPPDHFYHDRLAPLPPPPPPPPVPLAVADVAAAINVANENHRIEEILGRLQHQMYHPANPAHNDYPAWDPRGNDAAVRERTQAWQQVVDRDRDRDRERERDMARRVEAEMARVRARLEQAQTGRADLRQEREREMMERETERLTQRGREAMARAQAAAGGAHVDLGFGGGLAMGPGRGGGAGGGVVVDGAGGGVVVGGAGGVGLLVHGYNPVDRNGLYANFLDDDIDNALRNTLNALNEPHGLGHDGNMGIQNRLDDIVQDLGELDNDLDRVGDGIDQMQDDIEDARRDLNALLANAMANINNNRRDIVGHNNNAGAPAHGAGVGADFDFEIPALTDIDDSDDDLELNDGMYANPLFAPPVAAAAAAPPAVPVDGPGPGLDAAGAGIFDMRRGGAVVIEPSDNEDDMYVAVLEEVRPPPANLPTNENVGSAAPMPMPAPGAGGVRAQEHGARHMPQYVAGPSSAPTAAGKAMPTVIDVDAFQPGPSAVAAARPPAAGPSNTAHTSASNPSASSRPVDPIDAVLASILEVVPDVLPEHAATLARTHFPAFGVMHTAEHVLGLLFESKDYPRRGKGKGKGQIKSKEETQGGQGANNEGNTDVDGEADFLNAKMKGKPGRRYRRLAIYHFRQSFPHARASHLLTASSMRYARGHAYLTERLGPAPQAGNAHNAGAGAGNDARAHRHRHRLEEIRAQHYGVPARAGASRLNNAGVGMGIDMPVADDPYNPGWNMEMNLKMEDEREALRGVVDKEFAKERRWVERRYGLPKSDIGTGVTVTNAEGVGEGVGGPRADIGISTGKTKDNGKGKGKAREVALADAEDEAVEEGMGVECQCCFAEYAFSRMAQCPEAHLFCVSCISQYAAVQLGNMNPSLTCMHADGCGMPFGELELRRVLPRKLMRLYERVLSQKAVEGLEGLEACPFCEWKCVLDAPPEVDRLFRCGNVRGDADADDDEEDDECGAVSCRLCKKLDHTPKGCKEAEEDKHLDGQHAVEEAMTAALMRNCPKCKKAFIKEGGCNKMTCPYCGTHSCYTCRKQITGYDHFDLRPLDPGEPVAAGKCRTHDTRQLEEIHANEVKAAAEKALAEYKAAHPDAADGQIKVDIPEAPPAPPRNRQNRQNAFGLLGPRARAAAIMAGGHNIFGNGPWGAVDGAAALPNVPGWGGAGRRGAAWGGDAAWGGAGPAHNPAHRLGQAARDHLAHIAAHGAVPHHHMRLRNGAGNPQLGAAPAPAQLTPQQRLALLYQPLQHQQPAVLPPPLQVPLLVPPPRQHNNPVDRIGQAQPQNQVQLPPQAVDMAGGRPLGYNHLEQMRIQERLDARIAHLRALQVPVPPAPRAPAHPNFLLHRPAVPAVPQLPQPHQAAGTAYYDFGGLEHNNVRNYYPFLPQQRHVRQENAVAGPAYPGRALGDPPALLPPPRRVSLVPHAMPAAVPAPVPAPTVNVPQVPQFAQDGVIGMGMGMGFGAGMEMGMGFGAGMGMGLNMGMQMGAGAGTGAAVEANDEDEPANPPQGQGTVDTDAARLITRDAGHLKNPY